MEGTYAGQVYVLILNTCIMIPSFLCNVDDIPAKERNESCDLDGTLNVVFRLHPTCSDNFKFLCLIIIILANTNTCVQQCLSHTEKYL